MLDEGCERRPLFQTCTSHFTQSINLRFWLSVEEPDWQIDFVGWLPYDSRSVSFAETLQNSCGTLVDSKGNLVVDGKSRLSPMAQDVLSASFSTLIFCFSSLPIWTSVAAILFNVFLGLAFYSCLPYDGCCRMVTSMTIIRLRSFPKHMCVRFVQKYKS